MNQTYGCPEEMLTHYTCKRVTEPFTIDGDTEKYPWNLAQWSPRFVDMVTGAPGFLDTRCALVWDTKNLYVAFRIQEPDIQARMTERDQRVYLENDVEVFIGGEDCYYEFQINALGTIYEVFYIWQESYIRGGRFDTPEFDLIARNVDVLAGFQDGSRYERHPRGKRWAFMDWDFPGLQTAVKLDGTLNNSASLDKGWSVELTFPWAGMKSLFKPDTLPFKAGDTLRMDLSRFEKLSFNGHTPDIHPGWSLNAHGIYDSHIPECFSIFHLSDQPV